MKKRTALLFSALLLVGCGTSQPTNLLQTDQPLLNIEADADAVIEAQANPHHAWLKNKTASPIQLGYQLFWYDKNGVSQPPFVRQDIPLLLQAGEKYAIPLHKPTPESQNYRLYIRLK
ncbi:YcfL family protein [Pasteurella sp. PK-2025]|uniref:YcfL family protein n=1 Tax=unclassified Pasteurella TaxID=2621516 RepID=UPI003C736B6A